MKFRKLLVAAGALLPLSLVIDMVRELKELNKLMKIAYSTDDSVLASAMRRKTSTLENHKKPLFILHVGPAKTGTTTIQCAAADNERLLEKDNMYFLGSHWKKPEWELHEFMRSCYDLGNQKACTKQWSSLSKIVENHYKKGHNVLLSEEMITGFRNDASEMQNLWVHLEPMLKQWRVRIVFSYRRFSEWIPSKYHQAFSPLGPKFNKEKREQWPDDGGRAIPPFTRFFNYLLSNETFIFPLAVKKRWESHFPGQVHTFNFHQYGDMTEKFFCQMVPEAPNLCRKLQLQSRWRDDSVKNPSASKVLHFDMIAVRAYERGWVPRNMTRVQVAKAVRQYASDKLGIEKLVDFDMECFTAEQTQALLNQSIALEKELIPDFHNSSSGEREMRRLFDDALQKGKFCSVDLQTTLKQPHWLEFFRDLGGENVPVPKEKKQKKNKRTTSQMFPFRYST